MKALAVIVILATLLCFADAQTSTTTNQIRVPETLYMTTASNLVSISNAVKIASGLRVGMTNADVDKYMHDHGYGWQTNVGGMSANRVTAWFYPLATASSSLVLETECSMPPTPGLFRWTNPLLKRAYIQSQGVDIIFITLTNGP
jgi:hypothetical protein